MLNQRLRCEPGSQPGELRLDVLVTSVRASVFFLVVLLGLMGHSQRAIATATVLELQYYANGNVHFMTTPKGVTTFQYDALDRLTDESGPTATQHFTYDGNGNRTQDGGGYLTYPTGSNRVATRYGSTPNNTYDYEGRTLTDDGLYSYAYDVRGRLKTVKLKATQALVATYYYDYRNRRTRKVTTAPAQTTVYHYDQADRLIGESVVSGGTAQAQVTYLYNANMPVGQIQHGSPEKITYLHTDLVGAPRVGRDAQKKVVWQWDSDAFGATAANGDPDKDGVVMALNLRFPGQYYDAESSLHFNHNRFYHPKSGRYLQSDPVGLAGGLNAYMYARANPLKYSDSAGLVSTIIVVRDGGRAGGPISSTIGNHVALHLDRGISGQPTLYDPGGSYVPKSGADMGSGRLTSGDDASLTDYVKQQLDLGSSVELIPIPTTASQEADIAARAEAQGDTGPFFCAVGVSGALGGVCGIEPGLVPSAVGAAAASAQCQSK